MKQEDTVLVGKISETALQLSVWQHEVCIGPWETWHAFAHDNNI